MEKGKWKENINEIHPKEVTKEEEERFYKNIANYCQNLCIKNIKDKVSN
ncbi:MAG: hypothetical protein RSD14_04885 [Clostridia bacterium]